MRGFFKRVTKVTLGKAYFTAVCLGSSPFWAHVRVGTQTNIATETPLHTQSMLCGSRVPLTSCHSPVPAKFLANWILRRQIPFSIGMLTACAH